MAYKGQVKSAPYLAGAANNWNPKDPAMMMQWDGRHWVLPVPKAWYGTAYKLTLGSWETVECSQNGQDVPNRTLSPEAQFGSKKDTIWLEAAAFKPVRKASTKLPNVLVLEPIWSEYLKRFVTVRVSLPRGYKGSEDTYPVCYLHDGQNLFDDSTAFAGEWGIDEYQAVTNDRGVIVVGIDQANDRMAELSPFPNKEYGGGKGDAYLDFISKELKPQIDKQFRTKSDLNNTIIGGSSLGGLISYYALVRPKDKDEPVFGAAIIFSPAIWFNPQVLTFQPHYRPDRLKYFGYTNDIFLLAGGKEGSNVTAYTDSLDEVLTNVGYRTETVHDPEGQHNEAFWRNYIGMALGSVTQHYTDRPALPTICPYYEDMAVKVIPKRPLRIRKKKPKKRSTL
jgi:alpha-glucosidase